MKGNENCEMRIKGNGIKCDTSFHLYNTSDTIYETQIRDDFRISPVLHCNGVKVLRVQCELTK